MSFPLLLIIERKFGIAKPVKRGNYAILLEFIQELSDVRSDYRVFEVFEEFERFNPVLQFFFIEVLYHGFQCC